MWIANRLLEHMGAVDPITQETKLMSRAKEYWNVNMYYRYRLSLLCESFGEDVGKETMSYLPRNIHSVWEIEREKHAAGDDIELLVDGPGLADARVDTSVPLPNSARDDELKSLMQDIRAGLENNRAPGGGEQKLTQAQWQAMRRELGFDTPLLGDETAE